MPVVTVVSSKFPGISLLCPQAPDTFEAIRGSYYFYVGVPRRVTEETKEAIANQYQNFPLPVSGSLRIQYGNDDGEAIVTPPPLLPAQTLDSLRPDPVEVEAELTTLTEEDVDLINVEVHKLLNKGVAEAETLLRKTTENPDLQLLLRQEYLRTAIAHKDLQKHVKITATNLLKEITSNSGS